MTRSRAVLVAAIGASTLVGCGTQNSCEDAVDHLAACGITGLAVETCDASAEEEAQDILAQSCDSLSERTTSSFSDRCVMGWSLTGKCCKTTEFFGKKGVYWFLPERYAWGQGNSLGPYEYVCTAGQWVKRKMCYPFECQSGMCTRPCTSCNWYTPPPVREATEGSCAKVQKTTPCTPANAKAVCADYGPATGECLDDGGHTCHNSAQSCHCEWWAPGHW